MTGREKYPAAVSGSALPETFFPMLTVDVAAACYPYGMNITVLKFVLPFRTRAQFSAWLRHFWAVTAILAAYGTVCFLLAGRPFVEAAAVGVVSAPLFMLVKQSIWRAGIVVRTIRDRRRGSE